MRSSRYVNTVGLRARAPRLRVSAEGRASAGVAADPAAILRQGPNEGDFHGKGLGAGCRRCVQEPGRGQCGDVFGARVCSRCNFWLGSRPHRPVNEGILGYPGRTGPKEAAMTTAGSRKQKRRGWLPPRSGGYIPSTGAGEMPQPPKGGGGVGNLPRRDAADRAESASAAANGR